MEKQKANSEVDSVVTVDARHLRSLATSRSMFCANSLLLLQSAKLLAAATEVSFDRGFWHIGNQAREYNLSKAVGLPSCLRGAASWICVV